MTVLTREELVRVRALEMVLGPTLSSGRALTTSEAVAMAQPLADFIMGYPVHDQRETDQPVGAPVVDEAPEMLRVAFQIARDRYMASLVGMPDKGAA